MNAPTDRHWTLSKHAAYFVRVGTVKIERMQLIDVNIRRRSLFRAQFICQWHF